MSVNEIWITLLFFSLCISFRVNSVKMKKIKESIEYSDDKKLQEVLRFNYEMSILISKFMFAVIGILFLLGALILQQFN